MGDVAWSSAGSGPRAREGVVHHCALIWGEEAAAWWGEGQGRAGSWRQAL